MKLGAYLLSVHYYIYRRVREMIGKLCETTKWTLEAIIAFSKMGGQVLSSTYIDSPPKEVQPYMMRLCLDSPRMLLKHFYLCESQEIDCDTSKYNCQVNEGLSIKS